MSAQSVVLVALTPATSLCRLVAFFSVGVDRSARVIAGNDVILDRYVLARVGATGPPRAVALPLTTGPLDRAVHTIACCAESIFPAALLPTLEIMCSLPQIRRVSIRDGQNVRSSISRSQVPIVPRPGLLQPAIATVPDPVIRAYPPQRLRTTGGVPLRVGLRPRRIGDRKHRAHVLPAPIPVDHGLSTAPGQRARLQARNFIPGLHFSPTSQTYP